MATVRKIMKNKEDLTPPNIGVSDQIKVDLNNHTVSVLLYFGIKYFSVVNSYYYCLRVN